MYTSNPHTLNTRRMIPNDLLHEILKRVPLKSLMRFQCVSRIWQSIINDPLFIKAYPRLANRFLVSLECCRDHVLFKICSLGEGGGRHRAIIFSQTLPHEAMDCDRKPKAYTNIVNGFICFYRDEKSWLYDIISQDLVKLPDFGSTIFTDDTHFGFDRVNKRYKLLKILDSYQVAIFTVGVDSSWRIRDFASLPSLEILAYRPSCFGGILRWINHRPRNEDRSLDRLEYQCRVVAFDLDKEKFIHKKCLDFGNYEGKSYTKMMNFGPCKVVTRFDLTELDLAGRRNPPRISRRFRTGMDESYDSPRVRVLLYNVKERSFHEIHLFDPSKREWERIMMDSSFTLDSTSYFEKNLVSFGCHNLTPKLNLLSDDYFN
ncbi:OLC1v1005139C1 [Oldenlandia corymbosa var. corymbosa]|uniref:OLC1v1005139C1 n=1 Tax=Oldenlandia corymbosa var. corymbosa TaxID=529605 RepID=A0AAV1DF84_OLDCO|nr:OLC1v1005139C1 [Oldenlandia corymbosa var. corymbosa]